jgi:2-keto-4-pentenoate hydratase/2-oxohepta-3-ene-1,7-dioic acid hydratase in catechol pathway
MQQPKNIHCLALNYQGVGATTDTTPLYFVKSANAYCPNGSAVTIPRDVLRVWTEVELGIVVAEDCHNLKVDEVARYIQGFAICADITCENILERDHHLAFSKSRAGFCPVGADVVSLTLAQTLNLSMVTRINGSVTQSGSTSTMIMNAYESLCYLSSLTRLQKGDLILTGTPPGHENNTVQPDDVVCHRIETVGTLEYRIV